MCAQDPPLIIVDKSQAYGHTLHCHLTAWGLTAPQCTAWQCIHYVLACVHVLNGYDAYRPFVKSGCIHLPVLH